MGTPYLKSGVITTSLSFFCILPAESTLIDGGEDFVKETTEIKLVSPDVDSEIVPSDHSSTLEVDQNINHSCQSNFIEDVEIKDSSSEESGIGMAVDEQEAGPSGFPVEWQEATAVRQFLKAHVMFILNSLQCDNLMFNK